MVAILRQTAGQVILPRMLRLHPLPAFQDNYIWTLSAPDGRALVVDPGDAAPVLAAADTGLRPVAILLTHHHPDHAGGVGELRRRFDIPCFAPHDERITDASDRVGEGDRVEITALDLAFNVIALPGHTLSHIAFHGHGYLFCGDTLFSLGCGRMFEGTPKQMLSSLDKLAALPDDILVCCGHEYTLSNGRFSQVAEPDNVARDRRLAEATQLRADGLPSVPSTMASERACNPFLRVDQPGVQQTLQVQGLATGDREQSFAALRAWKDGFRA
jgi:hydroxyacylglutathione hydrolase